MYLYHVDRFVRHFNRPLADLGPDDARCYLLHIIDEGRRSAGWWRQAVGALRFLYGVTLGRGDVLPRIPYPKRETRLPVVLAPAEVERLLEAVRMLKHRMILMTIYSAGLRLSEATHLTPEDVDVARMLIHVRQGKGRRDRSVPLSPVLLHGIRQYRRHVATGPWLFPGKSALYPLSQGTIQRVVQRARRRAGLRNGVTPRTLRHSFATHLLETGTDIRIIQKLLGHKTLASTEMYTHVSTHQFASLRSPLDRLNLELAPAQLALPGLE